MVISVVPCVIGIFFASVSDEEAGDLEGLSFDADFSDFTGADFLAVGVHKDDGVLRIGFTHGAGFGVHTGDVSENHGSFGLTETFHEFHAGSAVELVIDFRIEGFAGDRGVLKSGEIIFGKIFSDEEAVHGRRSAEAGDSALGKERHDLGGVEAVEVIDHDGALIEPLTVNFSPEGLCPSGIADGEMQTVRIDTLPPAGSDDVTEGVGETVDD